MKKDSFCYPDNYQRDKYHSTTYETIMVYESLMKRGIAVSFIQMNITSMYDLLIHEADILIEIDGGHAYEHPHGFLEYAVRDYKPTAGYENLITYRIPYNDILFCHKQSIDRLEEITRKNSAGMKKPTFD